MPNRTADYIVRWVSGAKNVYNLDINYVGVSVNMSNYFFHSLPLIFIY